MQSALVVQLDEPLVPSLPSLPASALRLGPTLALPPMPLGLVPFENAPPPLRGPKSALAVAGASSTDPPSSEERPISCGLGANAQSAKNVRATTPSNVTQSAAFFIGIVSPAFMREIRDRQPNRTEPNRTVSSLEPRKR